MAKYLSPQDINYPTNGDTDVHYFVRLFEDDDLSLVQAAVNLYLLALESPLLPEFALIDTEHGNYIASGPPTTMHTVMLTLMWRGGPLGFAPPP